MRIPHLALPIDLKSFYASVECRERRLDPLDTRWEFSVADADPCPDKTICRAALDLRRRCTAITLLPAAERLFQIRQRVKQVNAERHAPSAFTLYHNKFTFGAS